MIRGYNSYIIRFKPVFVQLQQIEIDLCRFFGIVPAWTFEILVILTIDPMKDYGRW